MSILPFPTFSAKDARSRFGELLDKALSRPVGITKHDRVAAYLVSSQDFESMQKKIQELEDQLWLMRAEFARKEGFVDERQAEQILKDIRGGGGHAETGYQPWRRKGLGRSSA